VRRRAGNLFIEHRGKAELAAVAGLVGAFLLRTGAGNFEETLSAGRRGQLYARSPGRRPPCSGSCWQPCPSSSRSPRLSASRRCANTRRWPRVPGSYFRAARALLYGLLLCTLGIPLDSANEPWLVYEVVAVAVLALALVRVVAAIVALDQILGVARQREPRQTNAIIDPGL
jgi:hypothetical protein